MGGTTAKLCLIEAYTPKAARFFEVDRSARFMKGSGLPLRIPVIEMVEIGAGGGSIARVDALSRVTVGPDSAGAMPGPVVYGRGGDNPTVTDADLVLGRLDAEGFAGGRMRLDKAAGESALLGRIGQRLGLDARGAARAVAEIVDENMANASRVHAVESGENIARHTMVAFGGAAPLHACRVAEKLGIGRVIVPADAGVGSAVGFLLAPVGYEVVRSAYMRLDRFDAAAATVLLEAMLEEAHHVVHGGAAEVPVVATATAYMRYVGQGHEVAVALPEIGLVAARLRQLFEAAYARQFQRIIPDGAIEILTWAVTVATRVDPPSAKPDAAPCSAPSPRSHRPLSLGEEVRDVPVYRRSDFSPGGSVDGPCLIEEPTTTAVIGVGWYARLDGSNHLVLERSKGG
jgi:N-methylhydantoinase A